MKYRRLGRSGLQVSEISLGSWITLGTTVDLAESRKIILEAFDKGVNLFDTADVYTRGEAESVLGAALEELPREQVVVATKVMGRVWDGPLGAGLSRKHVFDACHASLRRLRIDYIDLYQAHAPDAETPLEESLSAFNDLVRQGKVRYLGLSNFTAEQTVDALRICERNHWESIVSHQPPYNLLDRRIEPALVPRCREEGIGFIVYSPLAQGVLSGKYRGGKRPAGTRASSDYKHFMEKWLGEDADRSLSRLQAVARRRKKTMAQVSLAWVLREPAVSSAIIGATSIVQLRENLKAASIKLTAKDIGELDAAFPLTGTPL